MAPLIAGLKREAHLEWIRELLNSGFWKHTVCGGTRITVGRDLTLS